jgi:dienelactone hydrolase
MGDVVLLHSAYGLRPAVLADARRLRAAGHHVTTPDLYEGIAFDDLSAGMAEKNRIGSTELAKRAELAVRALPPSRHRVFAGWSMGGAIATDLARQYGAAGLLLIGCELQFDDDEPLAVRTQIHVAEDDEWIDADDVEAAGRRGAEVFWYRGGHIFTDPGLADYNQTSADLLWERVIAFLG